MNAKVMLIIIIKTLKKERGELVNYEREREREKTKGRDTDKLAKTK